MGVVVIRSGRPTDVDPAVAVWRAASEARREGLAVAAGREEQIRRALRKPGAFLLVAEDGGDIVGMAVGMQGLADDGTGPSVPGLCFVSLVYVAPERWGEGIGGSIVDALAAAAGSRGYVKAQLWTHADNARARRLYEGSGFRRSGLERDDDRGERIVQYERLL